jgi:hypothetical protein
LVNAVQYYSKSSGTKKTTGNPVAHKLLTF